MKLRAGRQRWALSFADLCLLLLGFFVFLQAKPDANAWFEPGEAVLTPQGHKILGDFARSAGDMGLIVSSRGTEPKAARFDGWELAAARTAAVARELSKAGLAQDKVAIAIDPATGGGQVIQITRN